jgi:hypothetical protein
LAPLRGIRSKVTIEPSAVNRAARLVLVDELGELSSSEIHLDQKTQWIPWANVVLGPGEYEVVLQVVDSVGALTCSARGYVTVQ